MATNTTNLRLVKPEYSDNADIQVINGNMDIIDGAFKRQENALKNHREASELDHPNGSVRERHLAVDSVTTSKIKNKNVTKEKLAFDVYEQKETYTKSEVDNLLKNISSIEVRNYD